MDERSFVEGLLAESAIELAPDQHEELIADLELQLKQLFVLNLLDKLPQTEFNNLEDFMRDDPDQDAIIEFVRSHVGAGDAILAESRESFREQFLATQKK